MKQAIEKSPEALQQILQDVLELPTQKQDELVELLKKTSLSAIITASKRVTDRLDFIKGIEKILFDESLKEKILERKHLQRILAENTWLFGEEYNLSVDEVSLTEVLKRHLNILGRNDLMEEPVLREDGSQGRVDFMLSRSIPQSNLDENEHLIIEIKRPSKILDDQNLIQISSYADAVAGDERFAHTNTKWIFVLLGNRMNDSVERKSSQRDRAKGLYYDSPQLNIKVWVKTWGQIIDSCKGRLNFYQEHLKYFATHDSGLEYLKTTYAKYLPEVESI